MMPSAEREIGAPEREEQNLPFGVIAEKTLRADDELVFFLALFSTPKPCVFGIGKGLGLHAGEPLKRGDHHELSKENDDRQTVGNETERVHTRLGCGSAAMLA